MLLDDFDFELPEGLIAVTPVEPRDHSRLLVTHRENPVMKHQRFYEITSLLKEDDILVLNNTKVMHARLFGTDDKNRSFEIFLLEEISPLRWKCLARPGKRVGDGIRIQFPQDTKGTVTRLGEDRFEVQFEGVTAENFQTWLTAAGEPPLPPYIKREVTPNDRERYQTVYSKNLGSIAAPTAGLHFTQPLLEEIKKRGVEVLEVSLHVGYGTFAPIRTQNILEHSMHSEKFEIDPQTYEKILAAKGQGRRLIAVGTTSLRVLESIDELGPSAETQLFITPGYSFKRVDALITNFHLPQSSLYILVSAFLGQERAREAYLTAIIEGYRFYSYGDAMWID